MITWQPDNGDPYLGWIKQLDVIVEDQARRIKQLEDALFEVVTIVTEGKRADPSSTRER